MRFIALILTALALFSAGAKAQPQSTAPTPTEALRELLQKAPDAPLIPELAAANVPELAQSERGKELLAWAQGAAEETGIPETTYTLYRRFRIAGERPPYEGPYFQKRSLLTQELIAAWLQQDDSRIDRINDLLWSICEESTWVLPAHEKLSWHIDLFAAETGSMLAHTLLLMGDRLPEEIRTRVAEEVKRRILDNYIEHGPEYSWGSGRNNWTGVCAGSIGETFLLMESDPARQAQALALVLEQLERFLEIGFEEDGGCLEGIGYWNYGLSHLVFFAEMLRVRTGGEIDILANPKINAIARYPLAVWLGESTYASFADAHEHASVSPLLAARLSERTGETNLCALIGDNTHWNLGYVLRNFLWWDGKRPDSLALKPIFLPVSGIARLVGGTPELPLAIAAKAGHNAEPHNNNDVGSFILCARGETYVCDPGPGLYSKAYFGSERCKNIFANSYGHSVPRIGGKLQQSGRGFKGVMERIDDSAIDIRFEAAYGLPELLEARRTLRIDGNTIRMNDSFQFQGDGLEVEEAFVTWRQVEVDGQTARMIGANGTLELRTSQGVFTAEPLEQACKDNHKSEMLTRLTMTCPAAAKTAVEITMTYSPKQ